MWVKEILAAEPPYLVRVRHSRPGQIPTAARLRPPNPTRAHTSCALSVPHPTSTSSLPFAQQCPVGVYVAAGIAFKEFVYEPHIAPRVERWVEEFLTKRQARRARRVVAVPTECNYGLGADDAGTGTGTDTGDGKSTYNLKSLVENEVRQWGAQVGEGAGSGLRHRRRVPAPGTGSSSIAGSALDESNVIIPYSPMSPTHVHVLFDPATDALSPSPTSVSGASSRVPTNRRSRAPRPRPSPLYADATHLCLVHLLPLPKRPTPSTPPTPTPMPEQEQQPSPPHTTSPPSPSRTPSTSTSRTSSCYMRLPLLRPLRPSRIREFSELSWHSHSPFVLSPELRTFSPEFRTLSSMSSPAQSPFVLSEELRTLSSESESEFGE
ncbi:hypothetical protein B0H16DRAFT_1810504 [Mycena metata]|uniref:Uncharacterized protein n=1 Tax=Mycena metata TaxID=1033252 RepID=A0AAD7H689_9AGAR|nr:hypothetical protein B0H16DRAFT_1810504 [Mycena metata]